MTVAPLHPQHRDLLPSVHYSEPCYSRADIEHGRANRAFARGHNPKIVAIRKSSLRPLKKRGISRSGSREAFGKVQGALRAALLGELSLRVTYGSDEYNP